MRTFGTAELVTVPGAFGREAEAWSLKVEPHVAQRLKRVFGKVERWKRGTLLLSATEENCRDLEWFCQRYPLEVSHPDELAGRARAFDERAQAVLDILSGQAVLPPTDMQLPPRAYQAQAAAIVLRTGGLLLADQLGLGKTVSAITVLSQKGTLPALVVVPTHLPRQWKAEIERFLPFVSVAIAKRGRPYDLSFFGRNPDVIILNYHKLDGWADHLAGRIRTVVFDECQELRRGRHSPGDVSKKYAAAETVVEGVDYRLGLSATPIYNYGDEFFSVLEILRPGVLGSFAEFKTEWCTAAGDGKWKITNPKSFGSYLREQTLMLRRTRQEVGRELPEVQRIVHEVDSDAIESMEDTSELARIILSQDAKPFEKMRAGSEFDLRLRQATGIAKAPHVAAFVRMLVENGEPVVVYAWHRAVYDILSKRLSDLLPAWFTGSESPAKKQAEVARFLNRQTPVMMISLRSGSGLDGLQKVASHCVFAELDWSPGVIDQCIGRLDRDGQPDPVLAYFPVSDQGSDPVMVDILDLKRSQLQGVHEPFGDVAVMKEVDPEHVKKLARAYLERREAK